MSNEIACSGRGFLVFDYDAKLDDNKTERRKGVIDLGVVTKLSDTLSKSAMSNVNIVSMGQRYNYYIDNGNSRSISVDFERITPRYPMRGEDSLPTVKDEKGAFYWEEITGTDGDGNPIIHILADDPAVVDADKEFSADCTSSDNSPDFSKSVKWTNAYWAKALEKAIDRWQLKYNGVIFYYFPHDEALVRPPDETFDPVTQSYPENILPDGIRYDGYINNITYTHRAGEVERLSGSISFSVGRRIRRVQYSAA